MSEKPALPTEMTARQVEPKESAHGAVNGRGASSKQKARILFNRELSWLDFNARVLEEALNTANPLLERMKFLAIFSNNLDEFFMIYVPGMRDRLNEETRRPLTDRELAARHRAIKTKLTPMLAAQFRCYGDLLEQLTPFGIRVIPYKELSSSRKQAMRAYFESEIFPVLTPLAVGPSHPFPYISNLSLSLACYVRDPISGQERFARVKVPTRPVLPRLVPLPGEKSQYVLLEEVVTAHIDRLFPGMEVRDCYAFRVTRNADLELREDAANDLIEMIE